MNFLGVGPLELLLVLVIGLIVLGPERLQNLGRAAGKLVARLMAWQSQSPEAQLIQQIRSDFQQEIVDLRDELVRAKRQLNEAKEEIEAQARGAVDASHNSSSPRLEEQPATTTHQITDTTNTASAEISKDPSTPTTSPAPSTPATSSHTNTDLSASDEAFENQIGGSVEPYPYTRAQQTVARGTTRPGSSEQSNGTPEVATASAAEYSVLVQRLEEVTTELRVLREQLRSRGLIDVDEWPSSAKTAEHEATLSS